MYRLLLKIKPLARFFRNRFERLEPQLAALNIQAHHEVARPEIAWKTVSEYSDFLRFYSVHDNRCEDVLGINSADWFQSHFKGDYHVHTEDHRELLFDFEQRNGALDFHSRLGTNTWIYFVSRDSLPARYAIQFNYTPFTEFKEQLQFDFGGTSLADRHRFILSFNRFIRYQRIERGFWLPDVMRKDWQLPLGTPTAVRLEVVDNIFTLMFDGKIAACWQDERYTVRPSRNFLIFWSGEEAVKMDFRLTDFQVQFA